MAYQSGGFEVPCASIESVERTRVGAVSIGDKAVARLRPGMVALLETTISGSGIQLGAGYHARFTVPFGVAATAAYAAIAPAQKDGVDWTGFDVELVWERAAGTADSLLAEAVVTAFDPGLACLDIVCRTGSGKDLLRGHLRLRALRGGQPVQTALLGTALLGAALLSTTLLGTTLQDTTRQDTAPPLRTALPVANKKRLAGYSILMSVEAPSRMSLGASGSIAIEVANAETIAQTIHISLTLPSGGGIGFISGSPSVDVTVASGASATVRFAIAADRPDEVNQGRPWLLAVAVNTGLTEERYTVPIAVPDLRPPRVFYVLTEDCETFDGGARTGDYGASSCMGNANNFMDPEDYQVQMIEKPDRMNRIAERYGARFTHFWCVPQRFAVGWAALQSGTGAWPQVASAMDASVRRGSMLHEYAPHIHFDYEPDSRHPPQPRLLYDQATDGIIPNRYYDPAANPRHQFHDWDGSGRGIAYVKSLGDLSDGDSKAGSLRKSLAYLARMQSNRRYPIVARTGGFDFGISGADQEISTAAYAANGLRANSDARFKENVPARLAYWCDPRDRMRVSDATARGRLVQLAVTRETDFSDAAAENRWFASAIERASGPGVHLIASLTHAMFMRGAPDPFRSLDGGSFAGLAEHLGWVRDEYPGVEFATASDALVEFIDYYTPVLEASVEAVLCGGNPDIGVYEFGVRLLGAGIRVDERCPATVSILAPPVFESGDVRSLRAIANGVAMGEAADFDGTSRPALSVMLCGRPADLRLQVTVTAEAAARVRELFPDVRFNDLRESPRAPLFRMRLPGPGCVAADVLALLTSPVAGMPEPLGRRIHPWGVFPLGAAITAALECAAPVHLSDSSHSSDPSHSSHSSGAASGNTGAQEPASLRLRWRKALSGESHLYSDCGAKPGGIYHVRLRNQDGDTIADSEVELRSAASEMRAYEPDNASLAHELTHLQQRQRHVERGLDTFHAEFRRTLARYRSERAWKLMIAARRLYGEVARGDWRSAWLSVKSGFAARPEDELSFPDPFDYVEIRKQSGDDTQ